jgi:hypothetical protein
LWLNQPLPGRFLREHLGRFSEDRLEYMVVKIVTDSTSDIPTEILKEPCLSGLQDEHKCLYPITTEKG